MRTNEENGVTNEGIAVDARAEQGDCDHIWALLSRRVATANDIREDRHFASYCRKKKPDTLSGE